MRFPWMPFIACLLIFATAPELLGADEATSPKPSRENSLVDEPDVALRKFTAAPGLKVDLFAAEPEVRNPVAFSIDERGRVFVVESDRRRSSVFDIRGHKEWLDADFSFRTVQERAEFLKREVVPGNKANIERLTKGGRGDFKDFNQDGVIDWRDLEVQTERIRLLEDTNGDGRADRASIFADGFTNIAAGVAAGVLARGDDVYFACIPDLWRISKAVNSRSVISAASPAPKTASLNTDPLITKPLLTGFGVHIAFGGHDMHGLIFGPDGKLYWSIADRGTDTNLFAKIKNPIPGLTPELLADSGCIFRANPDGSDFEVIAWGLRNPQELAFDEYGNLFTADNNGDGGDKARWHYVVEGADFGWRIGWQWLEARAYQPKMGPWNGERLWHLAESNTAAYLLPPLAHIGHGPAGLAYNPGTGLPSQFDRHFFLCDFPGHVLTWTNIPDGASFKIGPVKNFFGDLGPTDVAFHPDGGVLVSDWFKSFDKSDKGRIYRIHDPATDASQAVQETKRLLETDPKKLGPFQEYVLMRHTDMRLRLIGQEIMVEKSIKDMAERMGRYEHSPANKLSGIAYSVLGTTVKSSSYLWERIHAIWGHRKLFCEMARLSNGTEQHKRFLSILDAPIVSHGLFEREIEVRAQSAAAIADAPLRAMVESGVGGYGEELIALKSLGENEHPRVKMFRALSLGHLGQVHRQYLEELVVTSSENGISDSDKRTRLALARLTQRLWDNQRTNSINALTSMLSASADRDPYLRHAAVLALARIGDTNALIGAANDQSRSVRLGAVLALRRLGSPKVARFLTDSDPQLVLEAARAINDVPIPAAYPQLAALIASDGSSPLSLAPGFSPVSGRTNTVAVSTASVRTVEAAEATQPNGAVSSTGLKPGANESELRFFSFRRALNANFRLGEAANAQALANIAARSETPEPLRIEALELLADWPKPPGRDHFTGLWRPLPLRDGKPAADALRPVIASLLRETPKEVRLAAARTAATLGVDADFFGLVADAAQPPELRVQSLKILSDRNDPRLAEAVKLALGDRAESLRIAASRLGGAGDATQRAKAMETGSIAERQSALASIGGEPDDMVDQTLARQMDALLAGTLPKELELDVLDAAQKRTAESVQSRFKQYQSRLAKDDPLASYRLALRGGNAAAGKTIFIENQQIACFRCHKINGEGGDVGPELTGLGEKKGREYLLESIVQPNKQIAAGFESVLLTMKGGAEFAGLVKSETETELVLNSPEDGLMTLKKADIVERRRGLSAMPEEMVTFISKRELRDLIEFLATTR